MPAERGGGAVAALPGGVLRPRGRAHRPPALPVRGGLVNRAVNEPSRNFTVPYYGSSLFTIESIKTLC